MLLLKSSTGIITGWYWALCYDLAQRQQQKGSSAGMHQLIRMPAHTRPDCYLKIHNLDQIFVSILKEQQVSNCCKIPDDPPIVMTRINGHNKQGDKPCIGVS